MKRLTSILLAMALLLTTGLARAAGGNAVIARSGYDGFIDMPAGLCAVGDVLWLYSPEGVYRYDTQSGAFESYPWAEDVRAMLNEGVEDEGGVRHYYDAAAWFALDGAPHIVLYEGRPAPVPLGGAAKTAGDGDALDYSRVVLDGGTARLERVGSMDWGAVKREANMNVTPRNAVLVNDVLCLNCKEYPLSYVIFLPLDGSAARVVPVNAWIEAIAAWDGGLILIDGNESVPYYALMAIDATREPDEWRPMNGAQADRINSASAVQHGRELLFAQNGRLLALDVESGDVRDVTAMPVDADSGAGAACLTASGLYASGSYEGVAVRSLDAGARKTLVVSANSDELWRFDDAMIRFQDEAGNWDVRLTGTDDILTALLTGTTDADVIMLDTRASQGALSAILTRGWAMELDDAALCDYVGALYPDIALRLTKDGKAMAVPFSAGVDGLGLNIGTMAALGLTEADVPASWPEFLDWLNALIPDAEAPLFEYDMETLLEVMLNDYACELQMGALTGYDTPELRAALAAYERLDREALEENWARYEDDESCNALVSPNEDCGVGGSIYESPYHFYPLRLSVSADLPRRMPVKCFIALVNPASENAEAAARFLNCLIRDDTPSSRATLGDPAAAPCRDESYAPTIAMHDARIARLEERLRSAADEDKAEIQEELDSAKERRAEIERGYWAVSAESLARYRANADGVMLDLVNDDEDALMQLVYQYTAGLLDADGLIGALQRAFEMRMMEQG